MRDSGRRLHGILHSYSLRQTRERSGNSQGKNPGSLTQSNQKLGRGAWNGTLRREQGGSMCPLIIGRVISGEWSKKTEGPLTTGGPIIWSKYSHPTGIVKLDEFHLFRKSEVL